MFGIATFGEVGFSARPDVKTALVGRATFLPGYKRIKTDLVGRARLRTNVDNRIFAATDDFTSRPTDAVAGRLFAGTVRQPLRFTRSIVGAGDFSSLTLGLGEAILSNASGEYDRLIGTHALDGRALRIKLGGADDAYDSFGTIFDGQSTGYRVDGREFIVDLRDNAYRLEVPASPNTYAGTGGIEGREELKGRRKPRAFGKLLNVTPASLSPASTSLYQVNDGPVQAITAVYVRGVAMTLQADYATPEALIAADVDGGKYGTCLAAGIFAVTANSGERGMVTADVEGDATGGVYVSTTADILRRLVEGTAGVTAFDEASLVALNTAYPDAIGYYVGPGEDIWISAIVERLMGALGGWGGFRRNGRFEVGVLRAPIGTSIARFTDIVIVDIDRDALPDSIEPPAWRYRMAYGRNWTVQDEDALAGSVQEDEARVAFLAEPYRIADPAEDPRIKINHPLAQDPAVLEGFFAEAAPAAAEALRRLRFFRSARSLYRMTLKTQPYRLDLGSEIHVTYPRWDLKAGKSLRVVEIDEDAENNMTEIRAFG